MARVGERSSRAELLFRQQAAVDFAWMTECLERHEQAERELFEAEVMLEQARMNGADCVTIVLLERECVRAETAADKAEDAIRRARRREHRR